MLTRYRLLIAVFVLNVIMLARIEYMLSSLPSSERDRMVEIDRPSRHPPLRGREAHQFQTSSMTTIPTQTLLIHTTVNITDAVKMPTPGMENPKLASCVPPLCLNYLNKFDDTCYKKCGTFSKSKKYKRDCRFMSGENRAPVALISLPGSGNTWLRELLQKATGICTGSVYCDGYLKTKKFNGENIRSGSVLVVKTHESMYEWTEMNKPSPMSGKCSTAKQPKYGGAIFLLRNPYEALIAEFNRQKRGHTGIVTQKKYFGNNSQWASHIETEMTWWKRYFKYLILEAPPKLPVTVIRYEDLVIDKVREVSRVLDFLNFPYDEETMAKELNVEGETFRRKRHIDFKVFTESQEKFVENCVKEILNALSDRNNSQTFGIENYIMR